MAQLSVLVFQSPLSTGSMPVVPVDLRLIAMPELWGISISLSLAYLTGRNRLASRLGIVTRISAAMVQTVGATCGQPIPTIRASIL